MEIIMDICLAHNFQRTAMLYTTLSFQSLFRGM